MLLIKVVVCAKSKQRDARLQNIGTIRHMRGEWPVRVISIGSLYLPERPAHS
jgi:hypothetical protein